MLTTRSVSAHDACASPDMLNAKRRSLLLGASSFAMVSLLAGCGAGGKAVEESTGHEATDRETQHALIHHGGNTTAASSVGSKAKAASTAVTQALVLGAFSGGYNSPAAESYDTWLGVNTAYNVDFLTTTSTSWDIGQWAALKKAQPTHNMLFSIPLTNMPGIVSGTYNATFASMATSIAAYYPNAIIRIGWEMNGSWYAWSAANQVSMYTEAYNQVAAIFREKSAGFMLDWCPSNGAGGSDMDCLQAYPGDAYVDCIGMDTYMDYRYGSGSSISRWNWLVGNSRGLGWQVEFAAEHSKKLSIPEWGVNLDDPVFIENMHTWLVTNAYHHASYWDSNSEFKSQLSKGQYPNAAAAYKSLFA